MAIDESTPAKDDRAAPEKVERPEKEHKHNFNSTIDNKADPPKRKVCGICGHWEAIP